MSVVSLELPSLFQTGDTSSKGQDRVVPDHGACAQIIRTENRIDVIAGLTVVPGFKAISVVHRQSNRVWLYSNDGNKMDSFPLARMESPSGMTTMQTKRDTIVISDHNVKCLHIVPLNLTSDGKITTEQNVMWTLNFKPLDVKSFKEDLLLIPSVEAAAVLVFNETGEHMGSIVMPDAVSPLHRVIGVKKGLLVGDCHGANSVLCWIDQNGESFGRYEVSKPDWKVLKEVPVDMVDACSDTILVTDYFNNRVHQLKHGTFEKYLLTVADGVVNPRRIIYDITRDTPRLLLACGEIGDVHIMIYDYKLLSERNCSQEVLKLLRNRI